MVAARGFLFSKSPGTVKSLNLNMNTKSAPQYLSTATAPDCSYPHLSAPLWTQFSIMPMHPYTWSQSLYTDLLLMLNNVSRTPHYCNATVGDTQSCRKARPITSQWVKVIIIYNQGDSGSRAPPHCIQVEWGTRGRRALPKQCYLPCQLQQAYIARSV